ncbi:hypothetical protein RRG08_027440 [Elysia crispata]|uniref:Uncharacterized protein n=1 Tax=Elysia crispata TaxID=231223 RepID=A0AAE1AMC3_9GAST|nr:hypothetical protein RRG08_027440 [Elysia crispata]
MNQPVPSCSHIVENQHLRGPIYPDALTSCLPTHDVIATSSFVARVREADDRHGQRPIGARSLQYVGDFTKEAGKI